MGRGRFREARVLLTIVVCAYVVIQFVVVAAWPVEYRFLDHTISDLGWTECTVEQRPSGMLASCSPRHALYNVGSAICWALLAAGAIALRSAIESQWARISYIALWVIGTLSAMATSIVPGNVDIGLHTLVALPQFLTQLILLPLTARAMWHTAPRFARAAAVTATLTIAGTLAMIPALAGHGPLGLTERLALESIFAWAAAVAILGPGQSRGTEHA